MEKKFDVRFLEKAVLFLEKIDEKAREKIIYNIRKAQIINVRELFKKLNNEIWEFRTLFKKTYYGLFAFWDKTGSCKTLVLTTHGIIKKPGKILQGEIEHALQVRKRYFADKRTGFEK